MEFENKKFESSEDDKIPNQASNQDSDPKYIIIRIRADGIRMQLKLVIPYPPGSPSPPLPSKSKLRLATA